MHPTITTEPIAARHRYRRGAGNPGLRMVRIPSPGSPNATDSNASPLENQVQSSKRGTGRLNRGGVKWSRFVLGRRSSQKRAGGREAWVHARCWKRSKGGGQGRRTKRPEDRTDTG